MLAGSAAVVGGQPLARLLGVDVDARAGADHCHAHRAGDPGGQVRFQVE